MFEFSGVWNADSRVMGITPFVLQDAYWGDQVGYGYEIFKANTHKLIFFPIISFRYVSTSGVHQPVFSSVQSQRCSLGFTGGGAC